MSKPNYQVIVEGVDYLWKLYEMEKEPDPDDDWDCMRFDGANEFYHFIRERCGYQTLEEKVND